MSFHSNDIVAHSDDASVSAASSTRYLSAYPDLHRLVNRLLEDAQRFVDDMVAEIRNRRHPAQDQQSSQSNNSNTKRRTRLQPSTKAILQKWFEGHITYPYPTPAEKQKLIEECGEDVTPAMVTNWFFNTRKRVRWRPADFQGGSKLAGRRRVKPNAAQEMAAASLSMEQTPPIPEQTPSNPDVSAPRR